MSDPNEPFDVQHTRDCIARLRSLEARDDFAELLEDPETRAEIDRLRQRIEEDLAYLQRLRAASNDDDEDFQAALHALGRA